ncbi:MAG: saccharopine dehydrogenase NADP-binding domain-containing protein, partial [Alphaproteobacteria bacterium]|nr:saccharopine dehydrogenase NADP-binding domain-containing protein [Alphaproteobacteria bacterium]
MTRTPRDQKPYDVIVLGATGYVGQLIAEYLATNYRGNEVRWSMAGRSQKKLDAVKAALGAAGAEIATLVADTSDMNALEALVDQGRVILT